MDELVSRGRFTSRAAVVRTALAALVEAERRSAVDEAIAEGYRNMPESDDEVALGYTAAVRLLSDPDLPW